MPERLPQPAAPLERELSLTDLTEFVARNWRFMSLCVAGVAAAVMLAIALQPKQYQRELTISLHPLPLRTDPRTPHEDVGEAAVKSLETLRPGGNQAQVRYDRTAREIRIALRARTAAVLGGFEPPQFFRPALDSAIGRALETEARSNALQLRKWAEVRKSLERDIRQAAPADRGRREALETQWARAAAASAGVEFDQAWIRETQRDVRRLSSTTFAIERDSGTQPARTVGPARAAVLAVAVGSIGAVIAALLREQWARGRRSHSNSAGARDIGA